jgi:hypothetical protein
MIVPSGWGLGFFLSLVYCGPRVGGLREVRQRAEEAGVVGFPWGWAGTKVGEEEMKKVWEEEKERWERKPVGKRIDYDKLGSEGEVKLGLGVEGWSWEKGFMVCGGLAGRLESYLSGFGIGKSSEGLDGKKFLVDQISEMRVRKSIEAIDLTREDVGSSLTFVSLTVKGRGEPDDFGILYSLSEETLEKIGEEQVGVF